MLPSVCRRVLRDDLWRAYIAESLYAHGNSQRLTKSYTELAKFEKPDTRTPDEIKRDIITRAGLVLNDESV